MSSAKLKAKKLRANIWEFFEQMALQDENEPKDKCKTCQKLFVHTGGTSTLIKHLR